MNLNQALSQLATDGNLNLDDLIAFAAEDSQGGRDTGAHGGGAVHASEGKVIYALIRALKPATCLELGVADGGSSSHILAALKKNGTGRLISYDIDPTAGEKVPADLRGGWTLIKEDVLHADFAQADFIFEDTAHTLDFSITLFHNLATLNPRIILTHDYYSHLVYGNFAVEQAFKDVFGEAGHGLLLDDAFTGLGYWWNPDYQEPQRDNTEPDLDDEVIAVKDVTPKAKPNKKAARRG
jgi:hypothetical protein